VSAENLLGIFPVSSLLYAQSSSRRREAPTPSRDPEMAFPETLNERRAGSAAEGLPGNEPSDGPGAPRGTTQEALTAWRLMASREMAVTNPPGLWVHWTQDQGGGVYRVYRGPAGEAGALHGLPGAAVGAGGCTGGRPEEGGVELEGCHEDQESLLLTPLLRHGAACAWAGGGRSPAARQRHSVRRRGRGGGRRGGLEMEGRDGYWRRCAASPGHPGCTPSSYLRFTTWGYCLCLSLCSAPPFPCWLPCWLSCVVLALLAVLRPRWCLLRSLSELASLLSW